MLHNTLRNFDAHVEQCLQLISVFEIVYDIEIVEVYIHCIYEIP